MNPYNRIGCILMIFVLLLSFPGCGQENVALQSTENNYANLVMNGHMFAYKDGFVYFTNGLSLYEYDIATEKTVRLTTFSDTNANPRNLFVTEEYIGYTADNSSTGINELRYTTRDGKEQGKFPVSDRSDLLYTFTNAYFSGDSVYYGEVAPAEDAVKLTLWRRNLSTNKEFLIAEIIAYGFMNWFLDENYIYVLTENKEKDGSISRHLLKSSWDRINFEEIPLSFDPIKVLAVGDDLYISLKREYNLYRYSDGEETLLPICSTQYQVLDGHLIFRDSANHNMYGSPLRTYNLETGEFATLCDRVFWFAILDNRYITYARNLDGSNFLWYIYDWQTGETKEMEKPV